MKNQTQSLTVANVLTWSLFISSNQLDYYWLFIRKDNADIVKQFIIQIKNDLDKVYGLFSFCYQQ